MKQAGRKIIYGAIVAASVFNLSGCGGPTAKKAGTSTDTPTTQLSGTAASGAPFSAANLTLIDATGTQRTTTASADGTFTFDTTGLTAPFAIMATSNAGDTNRTLVSVVADAPKAGTIGIANVTPLTTAIAALLSDSGNPLDLTNASTLKTKANTADIKKVADALRAVLSFVVKDSGGDVTFDPITTPFKADHTGLDAVLDTVKVTLADNGVILTNALAPVQETSTDPYAPSAPSVLLSRSGLTSPLTPLPRPTVSAVDIVAAFDTWRAQLNACFALSPTDRVTVSSGTVIALKNACAQISGFDPAYKSNGYTLLQRYGSLLSDSSMTGAKFGTPEILSLIKNEAGEDMALFRLPYTRADGDSNHVVEVAKKVSASTSTDSGWRVIGNQLDYDAAVEARFDRLTDMKTNKVHYRSAFRLFFNPLQSNATDVNAVRITGPGLPSAGVVLGRSTAQGTADYLQIQSKTGTLTYLNTNTRTASSFVLGTANADGSKTSWQGTNVNWADTPLADYSSIKPFSRYKFEVFRNTTDTSPKAVFYARLIAAPVAPTFGAALQWNALSSTTKSYLDPANTAAAAQSSITVSWARNTLAAPVEHASVFGSTPIKNILAGSNSISQAATSTVVNASAIGSSFGGAATDTTIPALNISGNHREITLTTRSSGDVRQYDTYFYQN